jgi:alpha-glucosidase
MILEMEKNYSLIFRVYDDGVAFRWRTTMKGDVVVDHETVTFRFGSDHHVYFPEEDGFFTHQERTYKFRPLSMIKENSMASTPVLIDLEGGPKAAITEADLCDYPGMYLRGDPSGLPGFVADFPGYPLETRQEKDRHVRVTRTAPYLAKTRGSRDYPWRVLIVSRRDADLVDSQLVYKLAPPLVLEDTSWIKPGKVAWDWWNANNVFGVDFAAGINTATYKYYIDFASQHGIQYIIMDEGWYRLGNLMDINPEIDMDAILAHAKEKGIGVILWVVWKTLDDQLHEALDQFSRWGIKGIKVDFMQRDDQKMVNFYHKIAREAAKHRLIVNFHGAYKPTGLRRAYPNVLTREGVKGLEHSKWGFGASPENALTIPFVRMLAGPLDYTPGAMINATRPNFKPVFTRPMSQGTRCHQLAMYVVFESPLQMLADSPSHYLREPECLEFLSAVPTVWDETRVVDAGVSDYILLARKSGTRWYAAALTDWQPRELDLNLNFLDSGTYRITIYSDGVNAARYASDYRVERSSVSPDDTIKIRMAGGGGWVAVIRPEID